MSARAQQPLFAELGKRHLPADRAPTAAFAAGDVDGDGDLDLVAAGGHPFLPPVSVRRRGRRRRP